MFERLTDRARNSVELARDEARKLNHNWLGTEHLLLGLLVDGEGVAARALLSLNVSLEDVRKMIEKNIGHGRQSSTCDAAFTPRARHVLEQAGQEAFKLNHAYIGTEHILLGLLLESDGAGAQILFKLGLDLNQICYRVLELLYGFWRESGEDHGTGTRVIRQVEAISLGHVLSEKSQEYTEMADLFREEIMSKEAEIKALQAERNKYLDLADRTAALAPVIE